MINYTFTKINEYSKALIRLLRIKTHIKQRKKLHIKDLSRYIEYSTVRELTFRTWCTEIYRLFHRIRWDFFPLVLYLSEYI